MKEESRRAHFEILRAQLQNERSSFIKHWSDLADYIFPRRPRFFTSDINRGDRRNSKIIDSSATLSARTLRSGLMSGVTSPARPWFHLTTSDPDLYEVGSVKAWLETVSTRMRTIFLRSNLYNALPVVYGDMGVFGTSAIFIEEDLEDGIRCYPFPLGSFMIGNNDKGKVDVFMREFRMTVRQLVSKFGVKNDWSNISTHVKDLWDSGHYETWIDIVHSIKPNEDYDEQKLQSKFKRYQSCYYEMGSDNFVEYDGDKLLSEKGYDMFPVLCPRWEVTGEDVYGTDCPGMVALGDIKQLQLGERRMAQAIEKMVNPPMSGPTHLRNSKASILPGDITYVDVREGQQGFRPIHEVQPRIAELEGKQSQIRQRISRAFFEDLFLMLSQSDRREITAREVDERHEEKLLALGPVLEQLNQDLLDPLIDNAFEIMLKQGLIPPPPEELQGVKLKVEYISIMAQAQKLIGIGGVERFAGFVSNVAAVNPSILDKVDQDQMIDVYGELTSIPTGIIRPDDEVQKIREQRAKAQQAQQRQEAINQASQSAKNLSQADMSGDSALTRILQQGRAGQLAPQ